MTGTDSFDDRNLLLVATSPAPDDLSAEFGPIPFAAVPIGGQPLLLWAWRAAAGPCEQTRTTVLVTRSFQHLADLVPGAARVVIEDDQADTGLADALATFEGPVDVVLPAFPVARLENVDEDLRSRITVDDAGRTVTDGEALRSLAGAIAQAARVHEEAGSADVTVSGSRRNVRYRDPVRTRTGTSITLGEDGRTVRKQQSDRQKLADETLWYRTLPAELSDLAPQVLGIGEDFYDLEKIDAPTLADIWVFGVPTVQTWTPILESLGNALDRLHRYPTSWPIGRAQQLMYVDKTLTRIAELGKRHAAHLSASLWTGPVLNGRELPGLEEVAATLEDVYRDSVLATPRPQTVIHGDFHLGNLFYLRRERSLKLIDPRGSFAGRRGMHGDPAYDELKLAHSLLGCYDVVSAHAFNLERHHDGKQHELSYYRPETGDGGRAFSCDWLYARAQDRYGMTPSDVKLGVSVMLLSLAVLHENPDQQTAHLLRGLELFAEAR